MIFNTIFRGLCKYHEFNLIFRYLICIYYIQLAYNFILGMLILEDCKYIINLKIFSLKYGQISW